ncbi:acyltransferase family protein [Rhizobium sp. TRM95111]|uniref:acyltransferase family protein n=1 Tax=Rhizobium alarense TaxID=2846851 RepID=UPI001F4534A4|nr:acyltransferase family protein [Rhizobium alarense]MCF3642703.1 acyltransferase family protein [Rhizobium alarense]
MPDQRRVDLDFVRVIAFGVLVLYHVSMIYSTHHFVFKARLQVPGLDVFALFTHPWRMSLIFFISGVATAFISKKVSPGALMRRRSRQLSVPLFLGLVFLVPPQLYVQFVGNEGMRMTFGDVVRNYFTLGELAHPTGNIFHIYMYHVWYLAYLLIYTLILASVLSVLPAVTGKLSLAAGAIMRGPNLVLLPVYYLFVVRMILEPIFGESLVLVNDWYAHAVYMPMFLFGFFLTGSEDFWNGVSRYRRIALTMAVIGAAVLLTDHYAPGGLRYQGLKIAAYAVVQWSAVVAVLGFARTHVVRRSPTIDYLNRGILTYYLLHQPVMLLFAHWLQANGLENGSSALVVTLYTGLFCVIAFELVRALRGAVVQTVATDR